jgi:hypothetical protein
MESEMSLLISGFHDNRYQKTLAAGIKARRPSGINRSNSSGAS